MRTKDYKRYGIQPGPVLDAAKAACAAAQRWGMDDRDLRRHLGNVMSNPAQFVGDEVFGKLAQTVLDERKTKAAYSPRHSPAPYRRWGSDMDDQAIEQIENACRLPVSVRGALMPDAHVGFGLPIGGVLAVRNAVIPYAVGVDIACRMKLTVLDLPLSTLETEADRLKQAIEAETRFGIGASFSPRRDHPVMDTDWTRSSVVKGLKDKAWAQLGTSGSGNHFVEFGELVVADGGIGIEPGRYLALLSHSGSRGTGAQIADHFSKVAMSKHGDLPQELRHLSWLDLDSAEGQEYWHAMELMGQYAAANHALIHRHVAKHLGAEVLLDLENHHNFAWKEVHDGQELVVHRKGATPAGEGVLGIIPGSMANPGYVVRGKGNPASLNSAAHGAGRRMSRKQAKRTFNWRDVKRLLEARKVTLLSAGLDEAPMAYKNIDEVMAAQSDLVETLARFEPRLVKMAPAGERPED